MQTLELDQKIQKINPRIESSPKKTSTLTWKDLQGLSWIFEENWQ